MSSPPYVASAAPNPEDLEWIRTEAEDNFEGRPRGLMPFDVAYHESIGVVEFVPRDGGEPRAVRPSKGECTVHEDGTITIDDGGKDYFDKDQWKER